MQEEGLQVVKKAKKLKSMKVESIFKPSLKKMKHRSAIMRNQILNSDAQSNQIVNMFIEEMLKEAQQQIDYRQQAMFRVNFLLNSQQKLIGNMILNQKDDEHQILCIADEEPPSQYCPKAIKKDEQTKKKPKRASRFRQFSILKSTNSFSSEKRQQNELADEQIELQKKQKENVISKLKKEYLQVIQNKIQKEAVEIIVDYRPDFSIQDSEDISIFRKNIFKSKRVSKATPISAHIQHNSINLISNIENNVFFKSNREYLEKIDATSSNLFEIKQNSRPYPRHSSLHHDTNCEQSVKVKLSDLKQIVNFAKPIKEVIKNRLKGSLNESYHLLGEERIKTEVKENLNQKSLHLEKKSKVQTQKSSVSKNQSNSFLPKISKR